MSEETNRKKSDMRAMLLDFDLFQYQLECAESAVFALRTAEEHMDVDGIMEKALYAVQSFLGDLAREQREWYTNVCKEAGIG